MTIWKTIRNPTKWNRSKSVKLDKMGPEYFWQRSKFIPENVKNEDLVLRKTKCS